MSQPTEKIAPLLVSGVYFFALLLILWPLLDLVSTSWPPQPGTLQWRYGFMGLTSSYTHTPVLGLVLAMGTSIALGHTSMLRGLSVLCLAGALFLLVVAVVFPLDALQIQGASPPEARTAQRVGGVIAEGKHITAAGALLLLGIGGWSTVGRLKGSLPRQPSSKRTGDLAMKPPKTRSEE